MSDDLIFKRDGWVPRVVKTGNGFALEVPVASGHAQYTCTFALTAAQVDILQDDEERYYFLYAALHHPLQRGADRMSEAAAQGVIATVLEGNRDAVEQALTKQDHQSNGAVSNLVRICLKRDQAPMRAGRWFVRSDS